METDKYLLRVRNVSKYFEMPAGAKNHALEDINMLVKYPEENGQVISILAPFGSGKTTLLRIIAGLEKPSSGEIIFKNKNYTPSFQKIIYIPEKPSSFPWLNVKQNLAFVSEINEKNDVEKNTGEIISLVGLNGYENHFPHNDSIGFRFRISLARALVVKPDVILIDDSLKKLDFETKEEIYHIINSAAVKLNTSFIYATTNISSAVKLSDSIFIMEKDPGFIFHELKIKKDYGKRLELTAGNFSAVKNEIEALFKSKNLVDEISFTI
ncbi:MAG: ATP-binding cassette domain-containing protein [Ignavibacteriaceae bacterium]